MTHILLFAKIQLRSVSDFIFPWLVSFFQFLSTLMAQSLQILHGMKILHVASLAARESWLEKALREAPVKLKFHEVHGSFEGMKALRSEAFDIVFLSIRPLKSSLDFIDGCRTSGVIVPMMLLGRKKDSDLMTQCCERGGNGIISLENTTITDLLWQIFFTIQHSRQSAQNVELRNRLEQEMLRKSEENALFIANQRAMLREEYPDAGAVSTLSSQYLELLKRSIPLGISRFTQETKEFLPLLLEEKLTAADLFSMHLDALETILKTPGRKSSLHLMNRANILVSQLIIALSAHYQQKAERTEISPISFDDFASNGEVY